MQVIIPLTLNKKKIFFFLFKFIFLDGFNINKNKLNIKSKAKGIADNKNLFKKIWLTGQRKILNFYSFYELIWFFPNIIHDKQYKLKVRKWMILQGDSKILVKTYKKAPPNTYVSSSTIIVEVKQVERCIHLWCLF